MQTLTRITEKAPRYLGIVTWNVFIKRNKRIYHIWTTNMYSSTSSYTCYKPLHVCPNSMYSNNLCFIIHSVDWLSEPVNQLLLSHIELVASRYANVVQQIYCRSIYRQSMVFFIHHISTFDQTWEAIERVGKRRR